MKKKIFLFSWFLAAVLLMIIGCSGESNDMTKNEVHVYGSIKEVPDTEWEKLSKKTIFFGHQSVGFNIIDGMQDIIKEYPRIKLTFSTLDKKDGVKQEGLFVHSEIGKNRDPVSKINDFASIMNNAKGKKFDIVFLKLCFIDIDDQTNIHQLLQHYNKTMESLKSSFPKTKFIHLTVPLSYSKTTWKTWLKKIVGKKKIWEYDDNIRKNEYNDLLRQYYAAKEPLFDLATIESTLPDGTRSVFKSNGNTYHQLAPDYTFDEGHLNDIGRRIVAEQLLLFLVNNQP
ncbi:MAG: SGNH/GDSL hydrolase family protein [Desulfobacteraceae bacterium]|nr:MAG: SGNH/GDSL hydrolase family protein [Desulfobacteraceae bacterium]